MAKNDLHSCALDLIWESSPYVILSDLCEI